MSNITPALHDKTFACNGKSTLKVTECLKAWILNQVKKYAEQIGITEQDEPSVVFTRKEVLAMPKELTAGRRTVTHKRLGICFRRARTILINVKKHTSYADLKHTVVHELVHYRFRYLKHGKRFEELISLILRGKRYKVKVLYIENPLLSSYIHDHQNQLRIHPQQSDSKYRLEFDAETQFEIVDDGGEL